MGDLWRINGDAAALLRRFVPFCVPTAVSAAEAASLCVSLSSRCLSARPCSSRAGFLAAYAFRRFGRYAVPRSTARLLLSLAEGFDVRSDPRSRFCVRRGSMQALMLVFVDGELAMK